MELNVVVTHRVLRSLHVAYNFGELLETNRQTNHSECQLHEFCPVWKFLLADYLNSPVQDQTGVLVESYSQNLILYLGRYCLCLGVVNRLINFVSSRKGVEECSHRNVFQNYVPLIL